MSRCVPLLVGGTSVEEVVAALVVDLDSGMFMPVLLA